MPTIAQEEKTRLINDDNERAIESKRNFVFFFTFVAYANSHFSRKCYTNLKVKGMCLHVCMHLYVFIYVLIRAFMYMYMHAYMYVQTHVYTNICIYFH